jgi:hypothetical protein
MGRKVNHIAEYGDNTLIFVIPVAERTTKILGAQWGGLAGYYLRSWLIRQYGRIVILPCHNRQDLG